MKQVSDYGSGWGGSRRRQQGMATLLIVLLIGVGLVAISLGVLHSLRSSQERQVASYAQINAQAGAWAAVEAARRYLGSFEPEDLDDLAVGQVWQLEGYSGLDTAVTITSVVPPVPPITAHRIGAKITSVAQSARASSIVEVVYEIAPEIGPENFLLDSVLDFYNTLNLAGGVSLKYPGEGGLTTGANFNVDGDFIATGIGIASEDLEQIRVTGNLVVSSGVQAKEVWARNVKLQGSAKVEKIYAFGDFTEAPHVWDGNKSEKGKVCCGDVILEGGGTSGVLEVNANGSVYVKAGSGYGSIIARNNIFGESSGGTDAKNLLAGNDININKSLDVEISAIAINDINIIDWIGSPQKIEAGGNIVCPRGQNEYFTAYKETAMKAGGIIDCVLPPVKSKTSGESELSESLSSLLGNPIPPITLSRPRVDAWSLRQSAHYAIEYEKVDGKDLITVAVKNINGLANGTYVLAKRTNTTSGREFLCPKSAVNDSGECEDESAKPFCSGQSAYNSCFEIKNNELVFNGNMMPPGVVWIDGSLRLQNGTFFNTFIVTGNIGEGGDSNITTYSLNYAAAYRPVGTDVARQDAICKNEFNFQGSSELNQEFIGMYPTDYCSDSGVFAPAPIGNVAFLAGGYDPELNKEPNVDKYTGGLISISGSSNIHGTVMAGDVLRTNGATTIAGYVSAAGLQVTKDAENKLTGSFAIDMSDIPDTYTPNQVPDLGGGGAGQQAVARVFWSRYL